MSIPCCRTFATGHTATTLSTNLIKTLITAILTLLAAGGLGFFEGGSEAYKKLEWWLLLIGAEVLVFAVVLVPFLLRAVWILQAEAVGIVQGVSATLRDDISRLQRETKELRDEIERNANLRTKEWQDFENKNASAKQLHDANIDTLNQLHTTTMDSLKRHYEAQLVALRAEIERQKVSDPKRNSLRREIKNRLDKFRQILTRIDAKHREGIEELLGHEYQTLHYLGTAFPNSYAEFGSTHPIHGTWSSGQHYSDGDFRKYADICRYRIGVLEQVLADVA